MRSPIWLFIEVDEEIASGLDARRMLVRLAITGSLSSTGGKVQPAPKPAQLVRLEAQDRITDCP